MARYIHDVPGRLRIKIPEIKLHPEQAQEIQAALHEVQGMERISVNGVTGSIVFSYDPQLTDSGHILDILAEQGFIESNHKVRRTRSPRRSSGRSGHVLGKALYGWAVEKALEPTGMSFLAALI